MLREESAPGQHGEDPGQSHGGGAAALGLHLLQIVHS